jgi:hypothetical protein
MDVKRPPTPFLWRVWRDSVYGQSSHDSDFICVECKRYFKTETGVRQHIARSHKNGN